MQKTEAMLLRVPEELKISLKESAVKKGYTLNGFVTQILWTWADQNRKEDIKNAE